MTTEPQRAGERERIGDTALARRLSREIEGEVLFDAFSRGRYSTDASIYQVEPIGVVVPRTEEDVVRVVEIAAEHGMPVLARGGGTSQCGQTVAEAIVVDTTKHLDGVLAFDGTARTVNVQPGLVLDSLNRFLAPHGLFFPVDPSTAAQATIGGMAGNNSCGARSIRYGTMADNVRAIEALLASGGRWRFAHAPAATDEAEGGVEYRNLIRRVRDIATREADEIDARFPKLLRRIGGYNLDTVATSGHNMARLLVGSEGTLAFFTAIELDLQPIPAHRGLGVCAFASFSQAMELTRAIVELAPSAVEVIDRTMIDMAREIPTFRPVCERVAPADADAILLVEFAADDGRTVARALEDLDRLMADHGLANATVAITDRPTQAAVWEMRKSGLNILMSMKGDGKPVSFIEDCAVPLEHLVEYTRRLTDVFARHGTRGTWYAHASVGCLHVRPILNMKAADDVRKMRMIAEEAFAMVREYKGSHSGEHGDGIVRSEFHAHMFGARIVGAFEEIKDAFDPRGLFNPGRIVRAPRMDDRRLFRYRPDYATDETETALEWSEWGGFARALEACNNNGACRASDADVMCPSFRATRDEVHVTRGRANALRLAISGQLGSGAMTSAAMKEAMALCVSCKGCRRECPVGVDMARMKIEYLARLREREPPSVRDRLMAELPRYAPWAARLAPLINARDRVPGLAAMSESLVGLSARRPLPRFRGDFFRPAKDGPSGGDGRDVHLLVDTFTTYFEPENAHAAIAVLEALGCRVHVVRSPDGGRAPCCGRTYLTAGLIREARAEANRLLKALAPSAAASPVVGLEPACLFTLRDELPALLPGAETRALAARAFTFEEFIVGEVACGSPPIGPLPWRRALVHGHCHRKAFGAMGSLTDALALAPGLEVEEIPSGCCGMAGAFGFEAEHYDLSVTMAEDRLMPAVRQAGNDTIVVADGTSCRHQIRSIGGREVLHPARVLAMGLGV
ncbi:MAG: FAD-linked oxidase C-terminal domain-containing protein [Rhodospirillales bacterium]|nr:FAD-linked oxidase C-terminal domain-containing protein [Rhodospirillales bacterium]MDP6805990.1 FAD-linked oxidase C-terminal domain-containing protein [Rhodospirillales bacterium]